MNSQNIENQKKINICKEERKPMDGAKGTGDRLQ